MQSHGSNSEHHANVVQAGLIVESASVRKPSRPREEWSASTTAEEERQHGDGCAAQQCRAVRAQSTDRQAEIEESVEIVEQPEAGS